jgi:hypothetical protein
MIEPFTSYFDAIFLFNNTVYAAILLRNSWLLFHKVRGPGGEQSRRLSTAVLFAGPQAPGLRTAQGNATGKAAHVTPGTAGLYARGKAAHVTPRTARLYGPGAVPRTVADGQSRRRIRSDLLSASGLVRGALAALFWGPLAALFWGPLAALF